MHRNFRKKQRILFFEGSASEFSDKDTAFQVHKVLHRLSEPYKEVFPLRVFENCHFTTISSLFGKSESWAESLITEHVRRSGRN